MTNVDNSGSKYSEGVLSQALRPGSWNTLPKLAAVVTAMLGLAVLAGWAFSIPLLKSVFPGAVEAKANTAVGLVLSACALFIYDSRPSRLQQRLAQTLALAVAALGLATLGEYLFGWQLGIDELLFRDTAGAYNAIRGRMSPYSAATFAMIGLALAILPWRALRALVWLLSILVMAIGAISLLGYLWNASELVTDIWLPPVAVNAAIAFTLLGAGIFRASWASGQRQVIRTAIEARILAGFISALVLLLLIGGYTYKTNAEYANSAQWVTHTQQVRVALGQLYGDISDIESSQRSLLLTGKPAYKAEFKRHIDEANNDRQDLARLISDNPAQIKNLAELAALTAHRIDILSQHIIIFEHQGFAAGRAATARDDGIQTMNSIRSVSERMDSQEIALLSSRETSLNQNREFSLVALLATIGIAIAILVTMFMGIRREIIARLEMEQELRASEENLSVTLNSIGDAVMTTDAGGLVTRLNILAEQLTGWTQAEALGRPVSDIFNIINQQTRQPASIPVADTLAQGVIHGLANDTLLIARDGSERPIADSCAPIRNRDGGVIGAVLVFRDVTREYAAQAALRDSATRIQTILDTVADGIITINERGIIESFNPAAERIFGYTAAEITGQNVGMLMPESHSGQHHGYIERYCATGEAHIIGREREVEGRRKDGSTFPLNLLVNEMHLDERRYFTGIMRDITVRKQAEDALRTSEERYRTLFESMDEGFCVVEMLYDPDGKPVDYRFVEINPTFEKQTGLQQALGKTIRQMVPDHDAHWFELYGKVARTGEAIRFENPAVAMQRHYDVFAFRIGGDESRRVGILFKDITENKLAEQSLRDSAARIQTILNAVAEGIITINERGFVETVNPSAEHIFGYTAAEIIGQNIKIVIPESHHGQFENDFSHYDAAENKIRTIDRREVMGLRKNGSIFPVELVVSDMWLGEQRYFTAIMHDISERKQAEELLHQAKEKAELANRAKDSFLATMSHEIRTPLSGMLGMLEVLSLTPLNHDQEETVQAAWDSGRSLLRIVSDILDWSKIEEGKLHITPHATSIHQLLQEVINTYSRIASAKSLVLRQHVDARISPAHIVDGLRLSQVLNNFVSNAIKFTHSGEIVVSAELLEQLESGERIRFCVKDTGIGIAKDAQQFLFRRYQQESVHTTRMYGGTGLGLAICQSLVDLMDGQIELVSEPGQGSSFCIVLTLPVSGLPGEALQTQNFMVEQRAVTPLFASGEATPLVLAVDDHPINRDLLVRQLKLLGLHAETAENGGEALLKWREGRFVLVITDCHMPEMDGYAFSRAVRKIEAEEKLPHTPIIAWTANALAEENEQCHASGMDDLLVKPVNLAQLKKTLAKWLSIAETDSSQLTPSLHGADSGQRAGPIDYAVLGQVVPDGAAQIQVLQDFQSHIRADRAKLLEMLEQGDQVDVERTAHRMKGSSRMVGAKDIANACAAIEQAAREGNMVGARAARKALDKTIEQLERYFIEMDRFGRADGKQ